VFVEKYKELKGNGSAAARAAGYSGKSAGTIACELLKKPHIKPLVDEWRKERLRSIEEVLAEVDADLAETANADPRDAYGADGKLLPVQEMPARFRRAIVSVDEEEIFDMVPTGKLGPRGGVVKERRQVGVLKKLKLHNKTDAKRLLYQRAGLLREQVDVNHQGEVKTGDITAEEWAALSELRHKVRKAVPSEPPHEPELPGKRPPEHLRGRAELESKSDQEEQAQGEEPGSWRDVVERNLRK